jgi:predicted nucleotidyltransferase
VVTGWPEVEAVFLFGSFLEDEGFRDVDVAVFLANESPALREPWSWETTHEADMREVLGEPVDLRVINGAPLGVQFHATAGILLFARDEEKIADLVEGVRGRYYDFRSFAQTNLREMLRA